MPDASRASRSSSPLCRAHGTVYALAATIVLLVMGCDAVLAAAARPGWFARPFRYVVINQDVRGILTELGRDIGVPVILSDKVAGRVRGEVIERAKSETDRPTAGEFLTRLAEANALTWYFDGSILYVSADQEYSTQLIEVGPLRPQAIVAELKRLSLMDERFAVRSAGEVGLISVSGPPAFIAIVRQVAEKLRPPPTVAGDDPRVRVFRGGAPAEVVRAQSQAASVQSRPDEASRAPSAQR
jgi:type II secretory pathway component GspD/PulD (secretin)